MKKLKKLLIDPERVIKNEELVNLRGGYANCTCYILWGDWTQIVTGACGYSDCHSCESELARTWPYSQALSIACE